MNVRQHRVTIFLNDEEYNRLYDAVAEEKRPVSKILRKALIEYLDKLEKMKGRRTKEVVTAV
jgi:metal-responsive CopG/Arc/MetJ family transcriptional regulator